MGGGTIRAFQALLFLGLAGLLGCGTASVAPVATPFEAPAPPIVELTVDQVQEDYALGKYTAVQLTQAFLDRISRYEDHYNAFISLNPGALETAAALDEEYRAKGPRGPLHGVPLVVKDNIDYGGLVTTAGYSGFSAKTDGIDMVPDDDAAVVERLREAGAIILGKTNLPDFAGHGTRTKSTVAGVTLNPYNVARAPGGSSGGTATAVNASFAVAGLGTETGGSIQNPSSAQALVGVKPTYGLVPLEGVVPMSAAVDVVGPMAKTVRDAAYILDVIAGPTDEDLRTAAAQGHIPEEGYAAALDDRALEGKRFGLVGEGWRTTFLPLAPETEDFYRRAIAVLEEEGGEVVEDPFLGTGFIDEYRSRRGSRSEGADAMAVYLEGLGDGAPFNSIEEWEQLSGQEFRRGRRREMPGIGGDSLADRSRMGELRRNLGEESPEEGEDLPSFQEWREGIQAFFRNVLEENGLDALFFPQAGAPIPDLIEDPSRPEYSPNNHPELPSNIVNDMGLPVVTVPFGYYPDGTPFVLAFIGDVWTEAELLAFAYDFERATLARAPPNLVEKPGG
jgi:Asp-tRNA(Asn)/Glu-tRNA(Gln) amidotransferase A subunit family amidase